MKIEERWKWRIRWGGRWTTTRITYTEAHIRKEHPEATRVEGTRVLQQVGEPSDRVVNFGTAPVPSGWPRTASGDLKLPEDWAQEERALFAAERAKDVTKLLKR